MQSFLKKLQSEVLTLQLHYEEDNEGTDFEKANLCVNDTPGVLEEECEGVSRAPTEARRAPTEASSASSAGSSSSNAVRSALSGARSFSCCRATLHSQRKHY